MSVACISTFKRKKKIIRFNEIVNNMQNNDIRWIQRLDSYSKALKRLETAVNIVAEKLDWEEDVDDLLKEGTIQRFEYTHELAWKVMKDYAEYQGYTGIKGSRDALRIAFSMELISDKRWMESIEDRNLTSHNYDDETAQEIFSDIVKVYYPLFIEFENNMIQLKKEQ